MKRRRSPESIMAVLSMDLIVRILDRVSDPSDLKSCRLVSRGFLAAELHHRRSLRPLRRLHGLLRRYRYLERLDLSAYPSLDDGALTAVAGAQLRSVNLSRSSGIGWRGIEALVAACPRLEALDLSYCSGAGDREAAAVASAGERLRELRMDKCLGVTDVGLAKVAVGCPRLQRLGIKWCMEISDIGIDLLTKKCGDLKALDISYLKVSNKALQSISSLGKLEVLSMIGCYFIDDEGLGFLNNGKNSLQSIDVSRCENVSSLGLASVIEGHKSIQKLNVGDCFSEFSPVFLSKLSGLKGTLNSLKFDGVHVSAAILKTIAVNCKNLVDIGLSKCRGVTDEGVCNIVSNCTQLRTIDLTCCHMITDESLIAIARSCKDLTRLQLESCPLITEKGLYWIGSCCSYLHEVDLTDCNIDDTALKCLAGCSELKLLKLGLCASISSKGLTHIAYSFRNLQELDLYRCTGVDDDGLAAIAGGCKKLKRLNICYCTKISDLGMKHISCLEELYDIELRGMSRVTSAGITSIAIGCKSLTELDLKRCYSVDDMGLLAIAQYSENLRQINTSYCPVTDMGLLHLLGRSRCIQDAKLVHLTRVTTQGFEVALRASWWKLKKLKLLSELREVISPGVLQMLQSRGCRLRWVNKPSIFELEAEPLMLGDVENRSVWLN